MYWSNQEVDNTIYPPCCPGCNALKWLDFDWETGLGYLGKPMNAGNLYRREFQPLLESAGLADAGFTIHSLRHTFATTLAEKGVHPSTAQKMLGHSDIRMTLAIYTHATDGMQDAATNALEEAFS